MHLEHPRERLPLVTRQVVRPVSIVTQPDPEDSPDLRPIRSRQFLSRTLAVPLPLQG